MWYPLVLKDKDRTLFENIIDSFTVMPFIKRWIYALLLQILLNHKILFIKLALISKNFINVCRSSYTSRILSVTICICVWLNLLNSASMSLKCINSLHDPCTEEPKKINRKKNYKECIICVPCRMKVWFTYVLNNALNSISFISERPKFTTVESI